MDFSDIYTQYIEDIKSNIDTFNDDTVKTYVETNLPHLAHTDQEEEPPPQTNEDNNHVPFAMKLFQRRIKKFSSYKENQNYIKKQNAVLHLNMVEKVKKEEEKCK